MVKIYKLTLLLFFMLISFGVNAKNDNLTYALCHTPINRLPVIQEIKLSNYPNPITTQTTISYVLPQKANVVLKVVDLTGKQLALLLSKEQEAGKQEYNWQLSRNKITAGMYILVLQVDKTNYTKKIIVQ